MTIFRLSEKITETETNGLGNWISRRQKHHFLNPVNINIYVVKIVHFLAITKAYNLPFISINETCVRFSLRSSACQICSKKFQHFQCDKNFKKCTRRTRCVVAYVVNVHGVRQRSIHRLTFYLGLTFLLTHV